MNKLKIQLDESRENIKEYQDEAISKNAKIKSLEDKISNNRHIINSNKNTLKERDNEIKTLKDEILSMSNYKEEKAKHEKYIIDLQNQVVTLKEDYE